MNPDEVHRITTLARVQLSDEEQRRFAAQLTDILEYFQQLQQVDTTGIAPAAHPDELVGPLREDAPHQSTDAAQIVERCSETRDGFFVVPRVSDSL